MNDFHTYLKARKKKRKDEIPVSKPVEYFGKKTSSFNEKETKKKVD